MTKRIVYVHTVVCTRCHSGWIVRSRRRTGLTIGRCRRCGQKLERRAIHAAIPVGQER